MRLPPTARTTRTALGAVAAGALLLGGASTASAGVSTQLPGAGTATTRRAASLAAYAATPADTADGSALTSRATTTRFGTVQRRRRRRRIQRHGVGQERHHRPDAGLRPTSWSRHPTPSPSSALTSAGPPGSAAGSSADRVILVGAGDPSLRSAGLEAMARTTAAALLARRITAAKVYVDDDVFPTPTLAYGWKASYVPDSIAPVRGLVRDQRNTPDTSADAGRYFRDRLKAHGVTAAGLLRPRQRRQRAPRSSRAAPARRCASIVSRCCSTATTRSPRPCTRWSGTAGLRRVLGRRPHRPGPRAGGAEARAAGTSTTGRACPGPTGSPPCSWRRSSTAASTPAPRRRCGRSRPGCRPRVAPARWRAGSPRPPRGAPWAACSPRPARSSDVVTLAGWATGADGRVKVFAFMVNGKTSSTTLRQNVDMLAATVTGCY